MKINVVTNPVQYTPVIQPAQENQIIVIYELADKINYLGNCYGCNKPEQVGETAQRKLKLRPKLRAAITEDRGEKYLLQLL